MSEIQPVRSLPKHEVAQDGFRSLHGSLSALRHIVDKIEGQDSKEGPDLPSQVDPPEPSYTCLETFLADLPAKLDDAKESVRKITERIETALF